jgi:hypothetical protein
MPRARSLLPDRRTLTRGLTSVLAGSGAGAGPVAVVRRRRCEQGTFPKEIVTCRCGGGEELHLFCKYGSDRADHRSHGHRGGTDYEAAVYREVLEPSRATTPRFYGTYTEEARAETWLVLGYLDGGVRVARTPEAGAMGRAADWIGRFHAHHERGLPRAARSLLHAYDADYYNGWARRTDAFAGPLHRELGWLAPLCRRFEDVAAWLLTLPPTVIHGEYYPANNILYSDRVIYPIDWESAAVGAGEIDLATLTEGWPPRVVRQCERRYRQARWPGGAPADFERRLAAARLYMAFRWLGEEPDDTVHASNRWRFEDLRAAGERLGLI